MSMSPLPVEQNQVIIKDAHCPYCGSNDAFFISEKKSTVISMNFPPAYGLKFLLSLLYLSIVHIFINGFKYFEITRKTEYNRYGFCPKCGNAYPANAPLDMYENMTTQKLYKVRKNRVITGLCRGISDYTGISLLWIRIVTLLYAFTVIGAFVYFLVAACVPAIEDIESGIINEKRFRVARRGEGRVFFGLCKGFSNYTEIPVAWVRFLAVILAFTIIWLILYIVFGIIINVKAKKNETEE